MPPAKFGRRTTAMEALDGADLSGKTAIITGGNSGIGVETVRALATAGAHVVLASRVVEAGEKVAEQIRASGIKGDIVVKQLDLADLASVRALAKDILATEKRIDLLILNAGIMACPLGYTKDGFELQIGTNHFGHFLLTQLLLPKMSQQGFPSRVVVVSSMGHTLGSINLKDLHFKRRYYQAFMSYGQSKLANVLFAKELSRRMEGKGVTAFSLHPGIIQTPLNRYTFFANGSWAGWLFSIAGWLLGFTKTPEQGAATTIVAALDKDLETQPGAYLSDCQVIPPSTAGRNMTMAKRLWEETESQIAALAEQ